MYALKGGTMDRDDHAVPKPYLQLPIRWRCDGSKLIAPPDGSSDSNGEALLDAADHETTVALTAVDLGLAAVARYRSTII